MTKADKILILIVMVIALTMLIPLWNHQPQPQVASVQVQNEEVLRIDLNKDAQYEVEGTQGPIQIEVKEGAIRVRQENSKHHYCSIQGFVSSPNQPIVCLPNETVITIEGKTDAEDVVIR